MAFDFGPSGRKTLAEIAKSPDKTKANLAKWALQSEDRWQLVGADKKIDVKKAEFEAKKIEEKVRVLHKGRTLPPGVYSLLRERRYCHDVLCGARWVDDGREIVILPPNASVLLNLKTATRARQENP